VSGPRNPSPTFVPPHQLQSIWDTLREITPLQQDEGDDDQRGIQFGYRPEHHTEGYWQWRARRMRAAYESKRQQLGIDQASEERNTEGNEENKPPRLVCISRDFLKYITYV